MANGRKDRVDRYLKQVEETVTLLKSLDRSTLEYLVRASEETSEIDGYPAATGNNDGSRGGRSILVTNELGNPESVPLNSSTEAAMFQRADDTHRDPLMDALNNIFTSLSEIHGHSKIINRKVPIVINAAERLRGRVSGMIQCQGCHRDVACTTADPIRTGYCNACDQAWRSWRATGDMNNIPLERQRFESQRSRFDDHNERACPLCADPVYRRVAS